MNDESTGRKPLEELKPIWGENTPPPEHMLNEFNSPIALNFGDMSIVGIVAWDDDAQEYAFYPAERDDDGTWLCTQVETNQKGYDNILYGLSTYLGIFATRGIEVKTQAELELSAAEEAFGIGYA